VQSEQARAAILSALSVVDMVVIFDADTPIDLIRAIKPDVLVKGGQYRLEEVVGYDVVSAYGGKVVRAEMEEGFSTTNTIARMAG
jgi:D-beta-D-heptose 7-phosphate kinase/D-beta-D-heptose 1-phosphate adenosyltransferase